MDTALTTVGQNYLDDLIAQFSVSDNIPADSLILLGDGEGTEMMDSDDEDSDDDACNPEKDYCGGSYELTRPDEGYWAMYGVVWGRLLSVPLAVIFEQTFSTFVFGETKDFANSMSDNHSFVVNSRTFQILFPFTLMLWYGMWGPDSILFGWMGPILNFYFEYINSNWAFLEIILTPIFLFLMQKPNYGTTTYQGTHTLVILSLFTMLWDYWMWQLTMDHTRNAIRYSDPTWDKVAPHTDFYPTIFYWLGLEKMNGGNGIVVDLDEDEEKED